MGIGTIEGMAWGRTDRTPPRLCRTLQSDDYALNELPQRNPDADISYYFSLTTQPIESLGQVFPVQEVLLVKIDLGQVLPSALDLHPAGGAGRIAAAVMRQRKAKRLGRF